MGRGGTTGGGDPQGGDPVAVRRQAALVAAVAGIAQLLWFVVAGALTDTGADEPPVGAAAQDFVDFYVDNFTRIRMGAAAAVVLWVLILVLLVAVVRAACRSLDLAAILAITLAGASVACAVTAEGALAWPTLAVDMTAAKLPDNLDPGVAQALLLSRDGFLAAAAVLAGVSVLLIAWLLGRSDLWGHRPLAAVTAVVGAFAAAGMVLGTEGIGANLIGPWGVATAVVLLVARRRLRPPPDVPPPA